MATEQQKKLTRAYYLKHREKLILKSNKKRLEQIYNAKFAKILSKWE